MINVSYRENAGKTLIHIGPASQARLDEYVAGQFQNVLILEPERERAAQLMAGMSKNKRVKVFHGALAEHEGEGELLRWNLDQVASMREATPILAELLPGLRVIAREPVPLISPSRLLTFIGDSPLPAHLVISFLGQEKDALLAWKAAGLLEKTCFIEVRSMQEQLFENAETRDAIEEWLDQQGFPLSGCDESDPDWPIIQFSVDKLALELNATKSRIAQLEEEFKATNDKAEQSGERIVELEQALNQQQARVAEAQADLTARDTTLAGLKADLAGREQALAEAQAAADQAAERNAELQQALEAAQAQARDKDARIVALEEEFKATNDKAEQSGERIVELEQALNQQQARVAEAQADLTARDTTLAGLKADLAGREQALAEAQAAADQAAERNAELQQALEAAQAQARDKDARIVELEEEFKTTNDKAEWRRKRIGELEQAAKEQEDLIAAADKKAEKGYADLGVATRMQALLQADLNELRARLGEAQEIRAAQEALLAKLTPRLQQAADQLRLLQMDEDEDNPSIVSAAVSLLGSEQAQPRGSKRSRSRRGADASSTTR